MVICVGAPLVVDGEDRLLGPAHQFGRVERRLVGLAEDFRAGLDQCPQRGLVADDLGVIHGVGGVGDRIEHFVEVGCAADGFEVARRVEPVHQQRRIDRLAAVVHLDQVGIELLVRLGVEILRPEHRCHVVADVRQQQHAADHAPLRLQTVRRQTIENLRLSPLRRSAGIRAIGRGHGK